LRLRARDGVSRTDAAVLGQPFLLQTRRIAPPEGGLLIASGHLVSGGAANEVDPASGELLGNFPQAFSHIGPVNAPLGNF